MTDLPLPQSPRIVLSDINKRIERSAGTWKDAVALKALAEDNYTPLSIRLLAKERYHQVAVPYATQACAAVMMVLDEDDRALTAWDLSGLSSIVEAEDLPQKLRISAAVLMSQV